MDTPHGTLTSSFANTPTSMTAPAAIRPQNLLTARPALRRPRPPPSRSLSSARLGDPHTRHSHPPRFGSGGQLLGYGDDTE